MNTNVQMSDAKNEVNEFKKDAISESKDATENYKKDANKLANKVFKKNANKTDSNIQSIIFLCFSLVVILVIFLLVKLLNYGDSHINTLIGLYGKQVSNSIEGAIPTESNTNKFTKSALMFGIILITIFLAIFVFQMSIGEKPQFGELVWSLIRVGVPIIGFTMIVIYSLPLMMRAFENTFGYAWISGTSLKTLTEQIFENPNKSYNDYSIIATQLSEENFPTYLLSMRKDVQGISRFKDVFLNDAHLIDNDNTKLLNLELSRISGPQGEKSKNPVYELLNMIVQKRYISEATWLSLAAVLTMYSTYLAV